MTFRVNDIRSQLTFGGARPTQFQCVITNPVNPVADFKTPFMAKAASLPGMTIGNIPLNYFGRPIQLAGDRTFEPWTVTIINDEDFLVRNALEEWNNAINKLEQNIRDFASATPQSYTSQATVTQFSKTGVPVRTYEFKSLWPSEIAPIDLSWDTTDTIEEFTVTFQYDSFRVVSGPTGDAGGE